MPTWQHYLQPQSVAEALQCLQSAPPPAKIVAGGTDLLLDLQQGRRPPIQSLIDVTRIPEMAGISAGDRELLLGAAVTHQAILADPTLTWHYQCLVEACGLIGGPQVRNVATIGGNIAHGLPAGDGAIAMLAHSAEAQLAGPEGKRWLPVEELFRAPGQTILDERGELLVAFRLPLRGPLEGSAFRRIMRPQGVAIAILNMGAWMRVSPEGTIEAVCLAVGPAGPRPFRARATESFLLGRRPDDDTVNAAAVELLGETQLRASPHRATREYRRHLVPVLLRRVLGAAYGRATGN